jgi:hypothetical protein
MLEQIFQNYKTKQKNTSTTTTTKKKKNDEILNDDFLNEESALSNKSKCDDVLNKYCTLYDEDNSSTNKYSIKPLNQNYLDQKIRRAENMKTAGPEWFNMKVPELTPELKEDLRAMQLKNYIHPSYSQKADRKKPPKFFQIGRIEANLLDGKKNRMNKKEVRNRLVEEIFDLDKQNNFSTKKFDEIQSQRRKIGLKKSKLNKYKMKSQKKGLVIK